MTIKHIVLSGGGPTGFITYGAVKHLAKENFWNLSDIESIYGCSIGAFMGIVISLGYDWDLLDDYFIKRPWNKLIDASSKSLIDAFLNKGILGESLFKDCIEPLLTAKNLDVNITMQNLYDINGINIHLYSTNLNSKKLEKIDISRESHPNLTVIKALAMSMSYPFIFEPIHDDEGNCYIDGGLLNLMPLNDCLEQTKCNTDEILVFKNMWANAEHDNNYKISKESTMMDYFYTLIKKMQITLSTEQNQTNVINTVTSAIDELHGFDKWIESLSNDELRVKLINQGCHDAKLFLEIVFEKSYDKN